MTFQNSCFMKPALGNSSAEAAAPLLIKVCGMREPANIAAVAAVPPDFMGFIFYPKSGRYVGEALATEQVRGLPCRTVGVFVNETTAVVQEQVARFDFDMVQLHGHETPAQCAELQAAGVAVMKAFALDSAFNFDQLTAYAPHCAYFLFDTKGEQPGGNGTTFDWELLRTYDLPTPYFLAGGLGEEHAEILKGLRLPGLYAVDLNSRFEQRPGLKDAARLTDMAARLRS